MKRKALHYHNESILKHAALISLFCPLLSFLLSTKYKIFLFFFTGLFIFPFFVETKLFFSPHYSIIQTLITLNFSLLSNSQLVLQILLRHGRFIQRKEGHACEGIGTSNSQNCYSKFQLFVVPFASSDDRLHVCHSFWKIPEFEAFFFNLFRSFTPFNVINFKNHLCTWWASHARPISSFYYLSSYSVPLPLFDRLTNSPSIFFSIFPFKSRHWVCSDFIFEASVQSIWFPFYLGYLDSFLFYLIPSYIFSFNFPKNLCCFLSFERGTGRCIFISMVLVNYSFP